MLTRKPRLVDGWQLLGFGRHPSTVITPCLPHVRTPHFRPPDRV
ncbi:hypothetical protein C791_7187 [Amycolatopsis azurea DSM 43854]|uniref:Uncharacterized protein n=1 Tax=Amycolatopsis azurea DSM 43854 TaxID=1238180 RepID=M2QBR6_9PSEU|nr:hypothetical protein C791_7187 [Amycolatopsis azurea DSM 43854]